MKIFIYWNRIDNDSRKIYKFLEDREFLQRLNENNRNVCLLKPYSSFEYNK